MKRYNVFDIFEQYLGYVIAKDYEKAHRAAIQRFGVVVCEVKLVNPKFEYGANHD